jgi:hypothetical protein
MKVALCMRGTVSKKIGPFIRKNDLYESSEYVDYTACYNSIKRHIINTNSEYSIDIFCQGWNLDLEKDIVSKYNPKKYCFENNANYNEYIYKLSDKETDFNGLSQALSFKKVIELKEEYEKENNINYDIVIIYRYDVLLWKDIMLKDYINLNNTIYVNAHDADGNGDFHFIMNSEKANQFKCLVDSIKFGNRHAEHCWIRNYIIKYMKTNIKPDNIYPGVHQEVIRKIFEFSINKNHLSIDLFNSYK